MPCRMRPARSAEYDPARTMATADFPGSGVRGGAGRSNFKLAYPAAAPMPASGRKPRRETDELMRGPRLPPRDGHCPRGRLKLPALRASGRALVALPAPWVGPGRGRILEGR